MATAMCHVCGAIGMSGGGDGFYYCVTCGTQSQDLREEAVEGEEMVFQGIYSASYKRSRAAPIQSQADLDIQTEAKVLAKIQQVNMTAGEVSARPLDLGDSDDEHRLWDSGPPEATSSAEDLSSKTRELYLEGMQRMIQLQCEALVEKFGVTPLICGTAAPIWLRFMASTRVCQRGWADEALQAAEAAYEESNKTGKDPCEGWDGKDRPDSWYRYRGSAKFKAHPRTSYGKKAQLVWARSLKDRIPVAASMAISFLACHMCREVILPTDIIKWVLEGKIPYLVAFMDIEKSLKEISRPWPCSLRFLLRPNQVLRARRLELMSAWIAKRIGLQLPPVNFHSISRRFLNQLQLPVEKIFPHVEHMYEWSPPPGLWLSAETKALPTRVYVMGMLVIVIKILYNLNGQGYWEKSLAINDTFNSVQWDESSSRGPTQEHFEGRSCKFTGDCVNGISLEDNRGSGACSIETAATGISTSSTDNLTPFHGCELDATAMLQNLESWDQDNDDRLDYARDLPTYLKYCKDVIFAGSKMSYDEENLIQHFWQLYERIGNEHLRNSRIALKEPMILGHESAGIVIEIGNLVKNLVVGDRVALDPGIPCYHCSLCKEGNNNLCSRMKFFGSPPIHGALTQQVVHPAYLCHKLPDNVSLEEGAMCEPLSVGVHACRRACVRPGNHVLILGAGPVGLMTMLVARTFGAIRVVVTDVDQKRISVAKELGADSTVLVCADDKDINDELGALHIAMGAPIDVTFECVGTTKTMTTALRATKSGGKVCLVGMLHDQMTLPLTMAAAREVDVLGIFRHRNTYPLCIELLESKKIDISRLITHRFKFSQDEVVKGFRASGGGGSAIKVMFNL